MLTAIAPRLISSSRNKEPDDPVRIYSDATGSGKLAITTFFSNEKRAPFPYACWREVGEKLGKLATTPSKISIFDLFASIATAFQLRDRFCGGKSFSLRR